MSIRHWSWFTFWKTVPMGGNGMKAYTDLWTQDIWKASLSWLKGTIFKDMYLGNWCEFSKKIDPSLIFPLFDTIPEDVWVYLSSSTFIDTDNYLGITVIFCFKSYCQIYLLAANISWLLVPPIFIKCDRTVILPIRMWTDIPSFSNIVNNIIANLAVVSHKTFMWDFRSSTDHAPFVVWPWQLAL